MPSSSEPRRSDTSIWPMRWSALVPWTLDETAAARFVSTAMRRISPTSITSQASAMAASIAPTYHDTRVATMLSRLSMPRASPLSVTS
ncbi:MAG: hypothetical protein K0Q43_3961 [Ramlibacter sp.]|nr:hypothetical protein [Ramlibacter sp.]